MNNYVQGINDVLDDNIVAYEMPHGMGTMYSKKIEPIVRTTEKVGRNKLCPCGSGLKYKKCCIDYIT